MPEKIKIRLSGTITVTPEQKQLLLNGRKEVLVEAIKHGGFRPEGVASISSDALGGDPLREEIHFVLSGDE